MTQLLPVPSDLVIAGFEPFSMVDWPGQLVATVFLQGCPWRCTYCHNPGLQEPRVAGTVAWQHVLGLLRSRRGQLDGVVFSGGEPTRQAALLPAIMEVRELGFAVGLHTAGAYPSRLSQVLPKTDWVGLDIKALPEQYGEIVGVAHAGERAWQSLDLVQASRTEYEVRITVDPTVHTRDHVLALVDALADRGVTQPVLQQVRATGTNPEYARALGGRGLYDVITPQDLQHLARR